jgi:DNA-directed RNA polymerase specialized sigma24 family protein
MTTFGSIRTRGTARAHVGFVHHRRANTQVGSSLRVDRSANPEQTAEALVNANLRALEQPVMRTVESRLRAEKVVLPTPDLEAAYNQAWHGAYEAMVRGSKIENLTGLLVDITYKRSIDTYRQRHPAMQEEADLESVAIDVDLAEQVDDQRKITRLVERLIRKLNTNERNAVTLCVLHGFKRPEAASILGIEEAAFQKIMDSATKKIAGVVAGMDARGCGGDEWARALRAFALGATNADSPDYSRIENHMTECASCTRYVTGLRGLAAVLPPIGLPLAPIGSLLGHIQRLIARGHGAMTMGTATAPTTATVAGTTAVGSSATGAGLSGLLGSGAIKAAIVAASIAVAGSLSVHATPRHHSRGRSQAHVPAIRGGQAEIPARDDMSAIPARLAGAEHSVGSERPTLKARTARRPPVAAAEFGFEGPHRSTSPTGTAATPSQHQSTATVAAAGGVHARGEPSGQTEGATSRTSAKDLSAEFGYEHARKSE